MEIYGRIIGNKYIGLKYILNRHNSNQSKQYGLEYYSSLKKFNLCKSIN